MIGGISRANKAGPAHLMRIHGETQQAAFSHIAFSEGMADLAVMRELAHHASRSAGIGNARQGAGPDT